MALMPFHLFAKHKGMSRKGHIQSGWTTSQRFTPCMWPHWIREPAPTARGRASTSKRMKWYSCHFIFLLTHRDVTNGPHTVWLDNFSKMYALHVATPDKGDWANCAWTGKALRKCSDATITMRVHRDRHGRVVPAMPRSHSA